MKNFFDCKDEKITEKAFSQNLIIPVVGILLCLVALCSMTYAWFTAETSSTGNSITSGTFDLEVTVEKIENGATTSTIEDENGVWTCELPAGEYQVTLTRTNGSTSNGYCYVKVGDGDAQPTATIVDVLTFKITVTEETKVTFEPRWGILTDPKTEIVNNGTAPVVTDQNTGD